MWRGRAINEMISLTFTYVYFADDFQASTTVESFTTTSSTTTTAAVAATATPLPTPVVRSTQPSICEIESEYFVSENGKESSVTLNLRPSATSGYNGQCKVTLTAPESYGFVVKFNRLKSKVLHNSPQAARAVGGVSNSTVTADNRTQSCPLKIVSFAIWIPTLFLHII